MCRRTGHDCASADNAALNKAHLLRAIVKGPSLLQRQNRKYELGRICKHQRGILSSHIAVARLVYAPATNNTKLFQRCIDSDVRSSAQGHLRETCGP